MRVLAGSIIGVFALASTAFAGDLSGIFGNTVTITDASGGVTSVLVNEDNTYTVTTPDGAEIPGTWEVADGQACFNAADAEGNPTQTCSADILGKGPGDSWTATDDNGESTISVVAGQ